MADPMHGVARNLAWFPLLDQTGPSMEAMMLSYSKSLCIQTDKPEPLAPPLSTWENTKFSLLDVIVNPTNEDMLGGGAAYGSIQNAVGPQLREACLAIPEVQPGIRCPIGEARITAGFNLRADFVIHTVGPVYGSDSDPKVTLRKTYRSCFSLAKEKNLKCIAFPPLACGSSGYPVEKAAMLAILAVKEFKNDFNLICFILPTEAIYDVWLKMCACSLERGFG